VETDGVADFLKRVAVETQDLVDACIASGFVRNLGEEPRETRPRRQALTPRHFLESLVVREERLQLAGKLVAPEQDADAPWPHRRRREHQGIRCGHAARASVDAGATLGAAVRAQQ